MYRKVFTYHNFRFFLYFWSCDVILADCIGSIISLRNQHEKKTRQMFLTHSNHKRYPVTSGIFAALQLIQKCAFFGNAMPLYMRSISNWRFFSLLKNFEFFKSPNFWSRRSSFKNYYDFIRILHQIFCFFQKKIRLQKTKLFSYVSKKPYFLFAFYSKCLGTLGVECLGFHPYWNMTENNTMCMSKTVVLARKMSFLLDHSR